MTISLQELEEEYNQRLPTYKQLEGESLYILRQELNNSELMIHSTLSRIKKFESICRKTEEKELKYTLNEITDVVGLRIVCLFISEINKIGDIIRKSFDVISEDNKIDGFDASKFGYMSVHFIVKIKDSFTGTRYNSIKNINFEIQVRTIAMDAWANISRHLNYHNELAIPKELKRDFYAVSGLFYVADTHFELFYRESLKSKEKMNQIFTQTRPELTQEINSDSLQAYLKSKFPDREHSDSLGVSELVSELKLFGYKNIKEVDDIIEKTKDVFMVYEKEHPPAVKSKRFNEVGVVRISFKIYDEKYAQSIYGHAFEKFNKYRELLKK